MGKRRPQIRDQQQLGSICKRIKDNQADAERRYNKSGVSFGTSRLRPPHLLNVSIDEAAVAAQQRRVQAADAEIAHCEGRHAEVCARGPLLCDNV